MEDELEDLRLRLSTCSQKYTEMRSRYVAEREKRLPIKIENKWNSIKYGFQVLVSSEHGTSLPKKIGMFFSTILKWARNGFKLEEAQVSERRLKICEACSELTKDYQCRVCGCLMKKKTKLSGASCPLNKW